MYFSLMLAALCHMLYLALHVSCSGSFPKPLSPEEEAACFRLIRLGDLAARNKVVEHNLRLVAHIAKKYYSAAGEQDDLISIGTIGLIKAASTFDNTKNIRFATYASKCIENEILMAFRSRRRNARDLYINDPIDTDRDGNSLTLLDIMSEEYDIVARIDTETMVARLREYLDSRLDPREKEILVLRYGLCNRPPLTQREVAKKLGISRSYVSRLESKALSKLREEFEKTAGRKTAAP